MKTFAKPALLESHDSCKSNRNNSGFGQTPCTLTFTTPCGSEYGSGHSEHNCMVLGENMRASLGVVLALPEGLVGKQKGGVDDGSWGEAPQGIRNSKKQRHQEQHKKTDSWNALAERHFWAAMRFEGLSGKNLGAKSFLSCWSKP